MFSMRKIICIFIFISISSFVNAKGHDKKGNSILKTYASIALANYTDALNEAKDLRSYIYKFASKPTQMSFEEVKLSWLKSRESYGQTEIFRLSNGPIDATEGWVADTYGSLEPQINAWPLDENMIDYTIDKDGKKTSGNIIDSSGKFKPGGEDAKSVDITKITVKTITDLNENGGEANVATGYHAIEFLLWGQDQDYASFMKDGVTKGALMAGKRTLSDFTTDKGAKRRLEYLKAAADKLVADITIIKEAWNKKVDGNKGLYRAALMGKAGKKNIDKKTALRQIFSGMGVFIKSELANERLAVALLTPSEEDEHSCFSDNTHRDLATNYQGFKNVLMGTYEGVRMGKGAFDALDRDKKEKMLTLMKSIESRILNVHIIAENSRHFDYQIMPKDPQNKELKKLKNELRKLGDMMVDVAKANGINLNVDDVTDAEETKV